MKNDNNDSIESLKNLFSYSPENVVFLDYDLKPIWCNNQNLLPAMENLSPDSFLEGNSLPLKSGDYNFKCNGITFLCKVINYEECGLYVVQLSADEAFYSFVKCLTVQKFLINQAGAVRQAVTGITASSNMLHKAIESGEVSRESDKYLDITMGNCYKLLRTVMNTTELIRYADNSIESKAVEASSVLEEFAAVCMSVLPRTVKIKLDALDTLYINVDPERFTTCLLSMIVYVCGSIGGSVNISITAKRIDEWVSITVKSEQSEEYSDERRTFSRFDELYSEDELNSDLFVINRFCRTFGGILFTACDSNGKSCSIKLPVSENEPESGELSSFVKPYPSDRFSKYHIALSEIADIFYY